MNESCIYQTDHCELLLAAGISTDNLQPLTCAGQALVVFTVPAKLHRPITEPHAAATPRADWPSDAEVGGGRERPAMH